jgi:hypothetical protein
MIKANILHFKRGVLSKKKRLARGLETMKILNLIIIMIKMIMLRIQSQNQIMRSH